GKSAGHRRLAVSDGTKVTVRGSIRIREWVMKWRMYLAVAAAVVLGWTSAVFAAAPDANEPTAAGLWEQSMNGRVGAWFFIFEQDGIYFGAMVKMFPRPGENPNPICTACPGDQRGRPSLGLIMIKGMRRIGRLYQNGTILDPRDGNVYNAQMEVTSDGQKLKLRGYVGVPLFGATQVWKRLPLESLSATEIPEHLAQYWPAQPDT